MQERVRQRIVINLDQSRPSKAPNSRGRSWTKLLGLLVILFIGFLGLVVIGAFLWWRHYQTTPTYSLALLIDAAQRSDSPTMDQVLDSDKIVDNLAEQVTNKAAGRYGATLSPLLRKRVEALVPSLMPSVKQIVHQAVANRVREIAEQADHKPFIVVAISLPYFVDITTDGDRARAIATVHERQVELMMQRESDRWRVTGIRDEAIVQLVVDEVIKDLPAIGQLD